MAVNIMTVKIMTVQKYGGIAQKPPLFNRRNINDYKVNVISIWWSLHTGLIARQPKLLILMTNLFHRKTF